MGEMIWHASCVAHYFTRRLTSNGSTSFRKKTVVGVGIRNERARTPDRHHEGLSRRGHWRAERRVAGHRRGRVRSEERRVGKESGGGGGRWAYRRRRSSVIGRR